MRFRRCGFCVVLLAFLACGFSSATASAKCRQNERLGNLQVCVRKCKGGKLDVRISGGKANATIPITINCLEMELPTDGGGRASLSLKHLKRAKGNKLTLKVIDLSGPLPREHEMEIKCK